MKPSPLLFSALVHGGAIGALVAVGAYAATEARRPPQVEIQHSVASQPTLTEPELEPVPLPRVDETPTTPPLARQQLRVSLARIRPVEQEVVVEPAPAEIEVVEPLTQPTPPAPRSVFVAASPFADNPSPPYPRHEQALGREGTVLVTARIDRFGCVIDVTLKKRSRYPGFNRAALAAVRKWRFNPGMRDGVAVEDEIDVPIVFQLTARQD